MGGSSVSDLLLDTCAFLWVAAKEPLKAQARQAIATERFHVSPITAWELACLSRKGRLNFTEPLDQWFHHAVEKMAVSVPPLSVELLIASQELPAAPPSDPADRIIIATARLFGLILVTRDEAILRYGRDGHARMMEC
jgi:PIN domain nuclease of toxin-antitoxin system